MKKGIIAGIVAFLMAGFLLIALIYNDIDISFFILLIPLLLALLVLCIKYSEIPFALFLFAGLFKGDPRIAFLHEYLDMTLAFAVITVFSLFVSFVGNKAQERTKIAYISPKFLIPYAFISFMMLISYSYSRSPIYGGDKMIKFLTLNTLAAFAPLFIFRREGSMQRFFKMMIVFASIIGIQVFIGYTFEFTIAETLSATYIAAARIGGIAVIVTLLYFMRVDDRKWIRGLYWLLLPLLFFSLFAPGGRGPIIAFIFSLLVVALYILVQLPKEPRLRAVRGRNRTEIILAVIIFFLVGAAVMIVFPTYFESTQTRLEGLLVEPEKALSLQDRLDRYDIAFESIGSFPPIVIGLGIGGYNAIYGGVDAQRGEYPHNIFLEIGSELGIPSLLAFIYLIIESIRITLSHISRSRNQRDFYLQITIFALLIYVIVISSVSGDIVDNRMLFTVIGMVFAFTSAAKTDREDQELKMNLMRRRVKPIRSSILAWLFLYLRR